MGTPKKKEMSETVWCCMYIIRVYSFLLMILGSGLVAVGLWLRLDPVTQQYVNSVEGLDQYYYGTYAMMGCGAFMILVGFLGCCGACCESQCLLCMYVVLLVCLFLMEVGGGVWAYFHKDKVKEVITEGLMTTVKDVYGKEGSGEVATKALDSLQSDLKCCGASAPTDWYNSYYSDEVSTLSLIYSVPDSCCKDVTVDCGKNKGVISILGDALNLPTNFYSEGCSEKLITEVKRNYVLIAGIGIGVGIVQVLGIIFALCMCCALRRGGSGKDYA